MNNSPLLTTAAVTSLVAAVISVLVAFGIQLTADQQTAIMGLVTVASPWAVWLVGRNYTTALSNPTDEDGTPLVRASDGMPTEAQTRSMGKR
jgi:hypothetical protein